MAEASAQNADDYDILYENWLAPETSNLQQLDDGAEDVLPNQDIREDDNVNENENADWPHIDQEIGW